MDAHAQAGMAMMESRTPVRALALLSFGIAMLAAPRVAHAQRTDSVVVARNDSVTIRLVDVDVRAAVQALSVYLDRPIVFGAIGGARVTLQTPAPVPRSAVLELLRGLLASQNLQIDAEPGMYRVRAKDVPPPVVVAPPPGVRSPSAPGAVELFVIRLRHARAADVAATVNALYGRASALGELGAPPQTLDQGLRQNVVPPGGPPAPQAVTAIAGRAASLSGETTIVPDARGNSLLIRANRDDFTLIEAAVRELDVRPLQVLIEVLIIEARKDRSFDIGLDASTAPTRIRGTSTTVEGSSSNGLGLGDFVVRVMTKGGVNLDATLRLAAARGDVSIVSRPVVIATNNQEAEILVGSQRPFVQVSRSLPTDAASRDQVVQYKDVGTRLIVKPTISTDGYVMLQVTQEVNSATTETAFNAPIISTRTVQTQLLIRDSQTVVLGGLSDKQKDVNQSGVPLLSSIPLIGGLFGHASRKTTETELFLFITPRVIRTDEDAESVTRPRRKAAEEKTP